MPGLVEFLAGRLDGFRVAALQGFLHGGDGTFDLTLVARRYLIGVVLEHLLGAIDSVVRLVARLHDFPLLLVVIGVGFGVPAHLLDLIFTKTAAGGNSDLLFLAGAEILGVDVQDAVGVNVEGDFDLRHTARGRQNLRELEFTDGLIVAGELSLALQDVDFHAGLVVAGGRENLVLLSRDRGVPLDEPREHTA